MKKLALTLAVTAALLQACDKKENESPTPTKQQFLTNGSSKDWNITAETPQDPDVDCRPTAPFLQDNTWTFNSDGQFFYDNGTLTEGSNCSDFRNLTGSWKFTENESKLLITLRFATDEPEIEFDGDTLFLANIKSLTAETFVLQGETAAQTATFTAK